MGFSVQTCFASGESALYAETLLITADCGGAMDQEYDYGKQNYKN